MIIFQVAVLFFAYIGFMSVLEKVLSYVLERWPEMKIWTAEMWARFGEVFTRLQSFRKTKLYKAIAKKLGLKTVKATKRRVTKKKK